LTSRHRSRRPPAWIRAIANDRESGATVLAQRAAKGLLNALKGRQRGLGFMETEELARLGRQLQLAQPAMAPLFHLANVALLGASAKGPAEGATRSVVKFLKSLERAKGQLLRVATPFIPKGERLLTHSASSAVEALLREVEGVSVLCTESRPGHEGLGLSRRLARAGVSVRLIPDLAAFMAFKEVALFLVGADALTPRGLIHKIGTAPLARWARGHGVPVFTLCTTQKFLPERMLPAPTLESEGLFDRTPWRHLTSVVTERGPMGKEEVLQAIASIQIARAWKTLACEDRELRVRRYPMA